MTDSLPASREGGRAPKEWRCFHCDEVFTDQSEAREHFGEAMDDDPLCKIKADEGGLVGEVRRVQAELLDALNERNSYENDARLWHESEVDRVRRIGRQQWWQALDSMEGRALAAEERAEDAEVQLASLTAQLTALDQQRIAREKLLGRFLDNHCANADREGMSALCECRLCVDTRAALLASAGTPE